MADVSARLRLDVERTIAGAVAAHDRLVDHLRPSIADGSLDLWGPSGWAGRSRRDLLADLIAGARRDAALVAHAGGDGSRVAGAVPGGDGSLVVDAAPRRGAASTTRSPFDPAAGAGTEAGMALLDELIGSAGALHRAWRDHLDDMIGDRRVATAGAAVVRLADLPLLRWRAVEVGHADLALVGFSRADWSAEYVRRDIERLTMRWRARQPIGISPLPDAVLAVDEPTRLAWLLGRTEIAGVAPAALGLSRPVGLGGEE